MKIVVEKKVLVKALQTVSRSIAVRATLPALSGVLMEVIDSNLMLYGSNLETAIKVPVQVKVVEEGLFLTGAKLLTDFVTSLPDGELELATDNNTLNVTQRNIKSTFTGMPYDEYPDLGFDGHLTPHRLPGEVLAAAVEHVSYAASTDDARAILTGLHIQVGSGLFELAATDGFRLAVEKMKLEVEDNFSVVVPARVMTELSRLIREVEQSAQVECGKTSEGTQMVFKLANGVVMLSRLLEGTYPPYGKIIPSNYTTKVMFDADVLAAEVKRAALFSTNSSQMLKVTIGEHKAGKSGMGTVMFESGGGQVGGYQGEVEVGLEGSENKIAFNSKYVLDFLARIKAKQVSLEMNRADTPGLWRAVGLEEYLYVVMPMNL